MKSMLMLAFVLMLLAATAWAGGDQNHGDKGKGKVVQVVGP